MTKLSEKEVKEMLKDEWEEGLDQKRKIDKVI